jgi:antitoxin PrlF
MRIATSKITSQGQVSIPAEVRKLLGVEPGATVEWDQDGDRIVVRRTGKYTFGDIRRIVFGNRKFRRRSLKELNEGKAEYIREKYGHLKSGKNARAKRAGAKRASN